MEGKGTFFILIFIVAILTLTLAVLAGYLFFIGGAPDDENPDSQEEVVKVPEPDELGYYNMFEEKKFFNLRSSEETEQSHIILVNIELIYYLEVLDERKDTIVVEERINAYDSQIKELVGTYFQQMTIEEAKKVETKKKSKEELKKLINELLASGKKPKSDIIYDVVFKEWFYQ